MNIRRVVVAGPPGSGKSTWVKAQAKHGDLVWDLDEIASVLSNKGEAIPREVRGHLAWPVMTSLLVMRDALLAWLASTELYRASVYIIVTNAEDAARVATQIGARLVVMSGKGETRMA